MADGSDGLGLRLAGANRNDVEIEQAQSIVLGYVLQCTL
jgi:hypothetical protein